MNGYIYCITNMVNGKQYVGKTISPIAKRFAEHVRDSRKPRCEKRPLYDAINKYGADNFTIEVLEEVSPDNLEKAEQSWIEKLNTYHDGYNATAGGDGKILYNYADFARDYNSGMLVQEIAEKHGCDSHTVTDALRALGIDGKANNLQRQSHAIKQLDLEGNYIQSFPSQREAARFLIEQGHNGNISSIATNIGRVLSGKRKIANGFRWEQA